MPSGDKFTKINLAKVKQLARFKIDYSNVRILEHVDAEGRSAGSFSDFRAARPRAPIQTQEVPRPTFPPDLKYLQAYSVAQFPRGKMLVAVSWDLYPSVKNSLSQYVADVANDGFYATVFQVKGGTPQELRSFLKGKLPMAGALLVGNLPVAWYEFRNNDDFFNQNSEFPCDLYYMDLNGTWNDSDADGKFDGHAGNVSPEIWVSRLWTPTASGNDAALINDYFMRNHQYRGGQLGYARSGLAYVDDDWQGFGDCGLDAMFPAASVETITEPATTDADRYKTEINQHRGWAQVCAHSSPFGHSFKTPGGGEWVPNTYLRDTNPPNAYLYNLFACSNARFTDADYMAGWYLFDQPGKGKSNGLVVVGSTKTGSMLLFENFYGPMGTGKLVGDAYKDWWNALGPDHDIEERRWYYGMTLLGDPTVNWWSGVVPIQQDPQDGDIFDQFPRKTNYRWDPIALPGVTYTLEIDRFTERGWAAEYGGATQLIAGMAGNTHEHEFWGMQRGRWRVRAKIGSIDCPWSSWRYFTYKV